MVQPANRKGRESGSGMKGEVDSSILSGSTIPPSEHKVAKVGGEGSNPFARSKLSLEVRDLRAGRASGLRPFRIRGSAGVPRNVVLSGYIWILRDGSVAATEPTEGSSGTPADQRSGDTRGFPQNESPASAGFFIGGVRAPLRSIRARRLS